MDTELRRCAQTLLNAAHAFWKLRYTQGQGAGVQWLLGTGGELVIFTRGEYKDRLMANIEQLLTEERLDGVGTEMPAIDEETC